MRLRLLALPALAALLAVAVPPSSAAGGYTSGPLPVPYAERNTSLEPALATAPDGTLWAASNFLVAPSCKAAATGCGTDVWTSRDGGKHWRWVANPFSVIDQTFAVGGYDVDIAVAQEKNSRGTYDIVVASLWEASNGIALSHDDGATWELLPVAGMVGSATAGNYPDRPWIGMDGACSAYLAYNQFPGSVTVMHRYDTCTARAVPQSASLPFVTIDNAGDAMGKVSGRFTVDAKRHVLYYPAVASLGGVQTVLFSVSSDGGTTWQLRKVAPYTGTGTPSVWPVTAAVDAAGALWVAWHDARDSYVAVSHDQARTWSAPRRLNAKDHAAVYPTVAAGAAGKAAVVWIGTDRPGPAGNRNEMDRAFAAEGALWRMTISRTDNGGRTWSTPVTAGVPVHRGALCVSGGGCPADGSRAVYDCFGVSLDLRGRLAAVYTNALPRKPGTTDIVAHTDFLASR